MTNPSGYRDTIRLSGFRGSGKMVYHPLVTVTDPFPRPPASKKYHLSPLPYFSHSLYAIFNTEKNKECDNTGVHLRYWQQVVFTGFLDPNHGNIPQYPGLIRSLEYVFMLNSCPTA